MSNSIVIDIHLFCIALKKKIKKIFHFKNEQCLKISEPNKLLPAGFQSQIERFLNGSAVPDGI